MCRARPDSRPSASPEDLRPHACEAMCLPSHEGRRLETAGDHAGVPRAGRTRGSGAWRRGRRAMGPRRRNPAPTGCLLGRCTGAPPRTRSSEGTVDPEGGMDLQQLLAAAQQMQDHLMSAQQELADAEVEGTSGGGLVKARVNGQGELVDLTISPAAIDPADPAETAQTVADLVLAAVNNAYRAVGELQQEKMGPLAAGLGQPGMSGVPEIPGLSGLFGGAPAEPGEPGAEPGPPAP